MNIETVPVDPSAVTYAQARELTKMISEAFARDPMQEVVWGLRFNFLLRLPHVDAANVPAYNAFLDTVAFVWLQYLADPANRCYLARDAENGAVVGLAIWLPASPVRRRPSLLQRLFLRLIGLRKWFWNWWNFGFGRSPAVLGPEIMQYSRRLGVGLQTDFHDERNAAFRAALAHKTRAELAETPYLADDTHWLAVLAVASAAHRRGVGRQLVEHSARQLPLYEPEFRDGAVSVRAPQQYALMSTAPGAKLYEALGWRKGRSYKEELSGVLVNYPHYWFPGQI